jgi:hypothetical protein
MLHARLASVVFVGVVFFLSAFAGPVWAAVARVAGGAVVAVAMLYVAFEISKSSRRRLLVGWLGASLAGALMWLAMSALLGLAPAGDDWWVKLGRIAISGIAGLTVYFTALHLLAGEIRALLLFTIRGLAVKLRRRFTGVTAATAAQ